MRVAGCCVISCAGCCFFFEVCGNVFALAPSTTFGLVLFFATPLCDSRLIGSATASARRPSAALSVSALRAADRPARASESTASERQPRTDRCSLLLLLPVARRGIDAAPLHSAIHARIHSVHSLLNTRTSGDMSRATKRSGASGEEREEGRHSKFRLTHRRRLLCCCHCTTDSPPFQLTSRARAAASLLHPPTATAVTPP